MVKLIKLKSNGDLRGELVVLEGNKEIPFDIARVFYMYNTTNDISRGNHANWNSEFVFICVNGSLKVKTYDGKNEENFILDKRDEALYLPKLVWKEMYDFSEDAVLLVLSNCKYDKAEYINDKKRYEEIVKNYE